MYCHQHIKSHKNHKSHTVITQLFNLIQAEGEPSVSLVKTNKQKITIPANNKVSVKFRIERSCLDQSIPVAFEPIGSDTHQDLHVMPSVLRLPKGTSSSIKISIINNLSMMLNLPENITGSCISETVSNTIRESSS